MSKALVTAAVLPSASRVGSPRPAARRVVFAFFLLSSRDDPLLSREHTHHHHHHLFVVPKSFSPPSRREETKRPNNKTKENKIVPSLSKKGRAFLPFFRRVDADIFFRAENISIPPLFFLC
tara:strand:+ start:638 stop:1000 length:363 start_codon:yes stop_codon:yes gene_type:complete